MIRYRTRTTIQEAEFILENPHYMFDDVQISDYEQDMCIITITSEYPESIHETAVGLGWTTTESVEDFIDFEANFIL